MTSNSEQMRKNLQRLEDQKAAVEQHLAKDQAPDMSSETPVGVLNQNPSLWYPEIPVGQIPLYQSPEDTQTPQARMTQGPATMDRPTLEAEQQNMLTNPEELTTAGSDSPIGEQESPEEQASPDDQPQTAAQRKAAKQAADKDN